MNYEMILDFDAIFKYGIVPHGVIHVGMYKAEEYPFYKKAGVSTIMFVEANKNLAHEWINDDPNCYVVHAAVSDKVEDVEFHITNNGASSSLLELGDHKNVYPHIQYVDTVKMKTTTLDTVIEKVGIKMSQWNILVFDIQGVELKAMSGLSDWTYIDAVFTEINYREMYKGCALEPEVTEFLSEKGFKKVEEVDTGCGWGDALYIRK